MSAILIHGRGIAALTVACELASRGFSVTLTGHRKSRDMQLAIESNTVQLIDEVFDFRLREQPFAHRITKRIIRGWTMTNDVAEVESLSVPIQALADALAKHLRKRFGSLLSWRSAFQRKKSSGGFVVHATGRRQAGGLTFGHRVATMASVNMIGIGEASVIARTEYGWAFLLPHNDHQGTLFAFAADGDQDPNHVLNSTANELGFSEQITFCRTASYWRPVAPSLSYPLVEDCSVLVGESAFTFDPICGDGVGYSVRSALLASAAISDNLRGEVRGLDYYVARLRRAFLAHLSGCARMYAGWDNAGWVNELERTSHGIDYLTQHSSQPVWS